MKLKLTIDKDNQWFVRVWILLQGKYKEREFKVDTGCNALVISHNTLRFMGFSTKPNSLAKLPKQTATIADGKRSDFIKIGKVALFQDKKQTKQIAIANAICHSTNETHDLIGTEVLGKFSKIDFDMVNKILTLDL